MRGISLLFRLVTTTTAVLLLEEEEEEEVTAGQAGPISRREALEAGGGKSQTVSPSIAPGESRSYMLQGV